MQRVHEAYSLLRDGGSPAAAIILFALALPPVASAATVTRQVFIEFNGTLSGSTTYVLGPGELDVTSTFRRNGSASMIGGVADIPGDLTASSGFLFNAATLGSLTTSNWVTESLMLPDVPSDGQPGSLNHFLDVQGDLFFRYSGVGASKAPQFGFYDGSTEPTRPAPHLPTNRYSHVALTWNGASRTLEGFVDGQSVGTLSTGNAFQTPSTNVGYGFFARTGFMNRAINGKLASVAFSTFTGAFNPASDFQLDLDDAPSLVLTMRVNTVTGGVEIMNDTTVPIALQGYEATSASESLNASPGGWMSLSDQNLDPVQGGDGPGETWEEGAASSAAGVFEGFLLGSSNLSPGASLRLGRLFDADALERDLEFRYRVAGQSGVVSGLVEYVDVAPSIAGDYDNDFDVDGSDLLAWQRALGGPTSLPNDSTPGVDSSDLQVWRSNFGRSAGFTEATPTAAALPEPTACALALTLTFAAISVSRGSQPRRLQKVCKGPRRWAA
jgi:hypothetical protein